MATCRWRRRRLPRNPSPPDRSRRRPPQLGCFGRPRTGRPSRRATGNIGATRTPDRRDRRDFPISGQGRGIFRSESRPSARDRYQGGTCHGREPAPAGWGQSGLRGGHPRSKADELVHLPLEIEGAQRADVDAVADEIVGRLPQHDTAGRSPCLLPKQSPRGQTADGGATTWPRWPAGSRPTRPACRGTRSLDRSGQRAHSSR